MSSRALRAQIPGTTRSRRKLHRTQGP